MPSLNWVIPLFIADNPGDHGYINFIDLGYKDVDQRYDDESCNNNDCIVLGGGFLLTHGFFSFMVMAMPLVISHFFPPLGKKCLPKTLEDMC